MKLTPSHIITSFLRKWRLHLWTEVTAYSLGVGVLLFLLTGSVVITIIGVVICFAAAVALRKPYQTNVEATTRFLDVKLDSLEYSSSLLLQSPTELSALAQLQQQKVAQKLQQSIRGLQPPTQLRQALITGGLLVGLGIVMYQMGWQLGFNTTPSPTPTQEAIVFKTADSISTETIPPRIQKQEVSFTFPGYTGLPSRSSTDMNIKVVAGTRATWNLEFTAAVDSVLQKSVDQQYPMSTSDSGFKRSQILSRSGFYSFEFLDLEQNRFSSELYSIEVVLDATPDIRISGLDEFVSFDFDQPKIINFSAAISDDFGVAQAQIIATVSKGSGESVKFREERIPFDAALRPGAKSQVLSKKLDLDQLGMEPGDELYFYVEAIDYKPPQPNKARSETFFAVVKDTVSYDFAVEGTLGVDRMPDYFRSQRQLIIDTEKLISKRKSLSEYDFKFTSNELGFDQKSLRLKYGAFMGIETEIALAPADVEEAAPTNGLNSDDPLAEYTHDHDGDNEHNLVDDHDHDHEHDHDEEDEASKDSKNPIAEFMHDHGDPEMATLFEESLKVKLNKALAEMWDAELYLRLYTPEESLPYQYKALKLIQEIKNTARIYVHRIGFDPPPIKEDKRLSGDLDEINSYRKTEQFDANDSGAQLRSAIDRLGELLQYPESWDNSELGLFEQCGEQLAQLAIAAPGKHLQTLQQLNWFITGVQRDTEAIDRLRKGLIKALPEADPIPSARPSAVHELNQLMLNELQGDD